MKAFSIVLGAALFVTGGAAAAQNANDTRCILLANAFASQTKDATQQKQAEDTIYFYLGRISGQPTPAQMKAVMDAQAKTLNDSNAGTLMGECVKAVQAKVQLLRDVAAQTKPAAQPTKPPANPQGR